MIPEISRTNPVAILQLFRELQLRCRKVQSLAEIGLCPAEVIEELKGASNVPEFGSRVRMNLQTVVRSIILRNSRKLHFCNSIDLCCPLREPIHKHI